MKKINNKTPAKRILPETERNLNIRKQKELLQKQLLTHVFLTLLYNFNRTIQRAVGNEYQKPILPEFSNQVNAKALQPDLEQTVNKLQQFSTFLANSYRGKKSDPTYKQKDSKFYDMTNNVATPIVQSAVTEIEDVVNKDSFNTVKNYLASHGIPRADMRLTPQEIALQLSEYCPVVVHASDLFLKIAPKSQRLLISKIRQQASLISDTLDRQIIPSLYTDDDACRCIHTHPTVHCFAAAIANESRHLSRID